MQQTQHLTQFLSGFCIIQPQAPQQQTHCFISYVLTIVCMHLTQPLHASCGHSSIAVTAMLAEQTLLTRPDGLVWAVPCMRDQHYAD